MTTELETLGATIENFTKVSGEIIELLTAGIRNENADLASHIEGLQAEGARLILLVSPAGLELVAFGDGGPIGTLLAFKPGMKVESVWQH